MSSRRGPYPNGLDGIRRLIDQGGALLLNQAGYSKEAVLLDSQTIDLVGSWKSLVKALAETFRK
jgi:hypothetical protein